MHGFIFLKYILCNYQKFLFNWPFQTESKYIKWLFCSKTVFQSQYYIRTTIFFILEIQKHFFSFALHALKLVYDRYRIFGRIFGQTRPILFGRIFGQVGRYADNKKRPKMPIFDPIFASNCPKFVSKYNHFF